MSREGQRGELVEVFYADKNGEFSLTTFGNSVPLAVIEWLIEQSRALYRQSPNVRFPPIPAMERACADVRPRRKSPISTISAKEMGVDTSLRSVADSATPSSASGGNSALVNREASNTTVERVLRHRSVRKRVGIRPRQPNQRDVENRRVGLWVRFNWPYLDE